MPPTSALPRAGDQQSNSNGTAATIPSAADTAGPRTNEAPPTGRTLKNRAVPTAVATATVTAAASSMLCARFPSSHCGTVDKVPPGVVRLPSFLYCTVLLQYNPASRSSSSSSSTPTAQHHHLSCPFLSLLGHHHPAIHHHVPPPPEASGIASLVLENFFFSRPPVPTPAHRSLPRPVASDPAHTPASIPAHKHRSRPLTRMWRQLVGLSDGPRCSVVGP